MVIRRKNPNVLQSDKNMGTSHDDVLRFVVAVRALFKSKIVSGCQDSRGGINITRTFYNAKLYVNCIPCYVIES